MKKKLALCGLVFALSFPALALPTTSTQPAAPAATTGSAANADDAEYTALREKLAARNKELTDSVNMNRATVKKNEEILKEAQKLDASNRKLEAEAQRLAARNADLQKQRDALKAAQDKGTVLTATATAGK
jgi:hypothetical protein